MITPRFSVRQDDERVYIDIRVIHIRSAGGTLEFTVEGDLFIFALNPYYLRLRFPGRLLSDEDVRVIEDEALKSTTTYENSIVHISITKETRGEKFEDLDMVTKLLARTANIVGAEGGEQELSTEEERQKIEEQIKSAGAESSKKPLIEEIDDNNEIKVTASDIDDHFSKLAVEAETFDWEIEQQDPGRVEDGATAPGDELNISDFKGKYGFNRQYSGVIGVSMASGSNDVNDVISPEESTPASRHQSRFEFEALAFDPDYYLSDLFDEPPDLASILEWESPANKAFKKLSAANKDKNVLALETEESIQFTAKENDYMTRIAKEKGVSSTSLSNSTYTTALRNPKQVYLGLVCILFVASYDERTTQGDATVESCWTVCKLCPLFSGLDDEFDMLSAALVACVRRALCFPLLRHFGLVSDAVLLRDVYHTLRLGRRRILRVLLRLKQTLESSGDGGQYFVYSKVWVDDYIAWLQVAASDTVIRTLAHELRKVVTATADGGLKSAVGLELQELEDAAQEALDEEAAANS